MWFKTKYMKNKYVLYIFLSIFKHSIFKFLVLVLTFFMYSIGANRLKSNEFFSDCINISIIQSLFMHPTMR
jgi:hypothetical protein